MIASFLLVLVLVVPLLRARDDVVSPVQNSLLCQKEAPDPQLTSLLPACRQLGYAFCVHRHGHLDETISQIAMRLAKNIAQRYSEITEANHSQQCIHAWLNAACSHAFPRTDSRSARVCRSVCTTVDTLCAEEGLACPATIAPAADTNCTDMFDAHKKSSDGNGEHCDTEDEQPHQPSQESVPRHRAPVHDDDGGVSDGSWFHSGAASSVGDPRSSLKALCSLALLLLAFSA